MKYFDQHHVPGCERNNAPPPQSFTGIAPLQSPPNIARSRARQMDPISMTLVADGVVVIGPIRPEATQNLPDPKTLKIAGSWGRWTRYDWVSGYDSPLKDWEENWLPRIKFLQNKSRRECMLVSYNDKPKGSFKYQPQLEDHTKDECWVSIVMRPGPGLPLFSKGSHTGGVTNPYLPLEHLTKGDIVIFKGSLYRQEPEAIGEGCMAIVLRYN